MAIKEQRTSIKISVIKQLVYTSSVGGQQTVVFDTNTYGNGVTFTFVGVTEAGSANLTDLVLLESDDSGMAGATVVPDNRFTNPIVEPAFDAQVDDAPIAWGVIGTKRFLRLDFDVTLTGSSIFGVEVVVIGGLEINPEDGVQFN